MGQESFTNHYRQYQLSTQLQYMVIPQYHAAFQTVYVCVCVCVYAVLLLLYLSKHNLQVCVQ